MFIFSYREKQVISKKHLDKCLKYSFNGKMFFKFQFILEIKILKFYLDYFTYELFLIFIIIFKERQVKQFLENYLIIWLLMLLNSFFSIDIYPILKLLKQVDQLGILIRHFCKLKGVCTSRELDPSWLLVEP